MIIIIIVIIKIMMINKKPKSLRRIELGLFFVVALVGPLLIAIVCMYTQ